MANNSTSVDVQCTKKTTSGNGVFPKTLKEFGYKFVGGRLRNIATGEPFRFEVKKNDQDYNQKHYDALGEVITNHVYNLLITEGNLTKCYIPLNSTPTSHETFIFHSQDALFTKKLMILIHGSGVVRAGQWSRRLIINDCLDSGSQLPFIKKAHMLGYGVIVLNTNDHRQERGAEKHAMYVWKEMVSKARAKHIAIMAHSFGGYVTVQLTKQFPMECRLRVFAVAFTDSVHRFEAQQTPSDVVSWFNEIGRNWVTSNEPLDEPVMREEDDMQCVSAGTVVHEETSWSSFHSIFDFFEQRYAELMLRRKREEMRNKE